MTFRTVLSVFAFFLVVAGGYGMTRGPDASGMAALSPAAGSGFAAASHKALYSFKMVSMEQGASINGISGKMYFEQDDACDAWTTDQRFTTEYYYPERKPVVNTSRYVAWEAKDGSLFHFSSEKQENGMSPEVLRGRVERSADGSAVAEYSRPQDMSFDLPKGYVLPTSHTADIIVHAQEGKKFYNRVLFDGTDAEGPAEVNAFIGKELTETERRKAGGDNKSGNKIDAALLSPRAWHVRMAFFPVQDANSETPAYEMDVVLHENGVVSHAIVDYKTFKIEQKLEALEPLPARTCP